MLSFNTYMSSTTPNNSLNNICICPIGQSKGMSWDQAQTKMTTKIILFASVELISGANLHFCSLISAAWGNGMLELQLSSATIQRNKFGSFSIEFEFHWGKLHYWDIWETNVDAFTGKECQSNTSVWRGFVQRSWQLLGWYPNCNQVGTKPITKPAIPLALPLTVDNEDRSPPFPTASVVHFLSLLMPFDIK